MADLQISLFSGHMHFSSEVNMHSSNGAQTPVRICKIDPSSKFTVLSQPRHTRLFFLQKQASDADFIQKSIQNSACVLVLPRLTTFMPLFLVESEPNIACSILPFRQKSCFLRPAQCGCVLVGH